MIFGIGNDIAVVERFQRFLDDGNTAILKRLFSEAEQLTCEKRKSAASCYAARFAAKEAFLKALGTGLRNGITWHDMEIVNNDMGKPSLLLSGKAAEIFKSRGLTASHLSLSHDGGHAVAIVILEA